VAAALSAGTVTLIALAGKAGSGPLAALRQLLAPRREEERIRLTLRRCSHGPVSCLRAVLEVPRIRFAEVARGLATAVAEVASREAATVGCVGIVPGEEPILVALAARRELVADHLLRTLSAGAAHRHPHLWLALPQGIHLASCVDPTVPFAPDDAAVGRLLATGTVRHALLVEVVPAGRDARVELVLYTRSGAAGRLLAVGRAELRRIPAWQSAR